MQTKHIVFLFSAITLLATPHAHAMKTNGIVQRAIYKRHRKTTSQRTLSVINANQILQNLACTNTHGLLNEYYAPIISDSIVLFRDTPGFIETLSKFIQNLKNRREHIAKGYWYEIITAHKLTTIEDQTVLGFNQIIENPHTKLRREFDIITDSSWIECKNRDWSIVDRLKASRKQLHKQLLDQKKIVALHNTYNTYEVPIEYELHSHHTISPAFKKWLNKHGITYSENS